MMKRGLNLADIDTKWWSNLLIVDGWKEKVSLAIFPGLFVALFLNVFQPFSVNNADGNWRFMLALSGYGVLVSLIVLWSEFIFRPLCTYLFPSQPKSIWSEGAWYVWHFITVAIGMMLYREYLCYGYLNWPPAAVVFTMIYRTCMIGLIPLALLLFGQKLQYLHAYVDYLDSQKRSRKEKIQLSGENGKDKLILAPDDFLYISCSDNYAEVYFQKEGKVKKVMLRSSMLRLEELTKEQASIIRCHRSYIVNLDKVSFLEPKGKGFLLHVQGLTQPLPVSLKYRDQVGAQLT